MNLGGILILEVAINDREGVSVPWIKSRLLSLLDHCKDWVRFGL